MTCFWEAKTGVFNYLDTAETISFSSLLRFSSLFLVMFLFISFVHFSLLTFTSLSLTGLNSKLQARARANPLLSPLRRPFFLIAPPCTYPGQGRASTVSRPRVCVRMCVCACYATLLLPFIDTSALGEVFTKPLSKRHGGEVQRTGIWKFHFRDRDRIGGLSASGNHHGLVV